MKFYARHFTIWFFITTVIATSFVCGCHTSQGKSVQDRRPVGLTLHQCIKLTQTRAIHIGMDTNDLKRILGAQVSIYDDNEKALVHIYDPANARILLGYALAAGWRIYFTINKSGFVTWYVFTNASNKE